MHTGRFPSKKGLARQGTYHSIVITMDHVNNVWAFLDGKCRMRTHLKVWWFSRTQ